MNILLISALFPPEAHGGAEDSAFNQAMWLRKQGHTVHVLATASDQKDAFEDKEIDGLRMWRIFLPRMYPVYRFHEAPQWQKPLWHLQDHIDPRNRTAVANVLDKVRPDVVLVHIIQGIGYNALLEIAARKIPTVFILHDVGFACVRMSLYRNGKRCEKQCAVCKASAFYKKSIVSQFDRVGFCSPSTANLEKLATFFPVKDYPHATILNANKYPAPNIVGTRKKDGTQFLFVGRLEGQKGVSVLLEAAEALSKTKQIFLTLVGNGRDEAALKEAYASRPWCRFTGRITQQEIANYMAESDVLCIPSTSWENSPGVAVHALSLGLPVLGSHTGGIPELVLDGKNGMLVPPGNVQEWQKALSFVADNPGIVHGWRSFAQNHTEEFDQDFIGRKMMAFINDIMDGHRG